MSLCGCGSENANGTRGSIYCGGNRAEIIRSLEPMSRQDILEDEPWEVSLSLFLVLYRVCIYLFICLFAAPFDMGDLNSSDPHMLQWKPQILTTGPPEKSQEASLDNRLRLSQPVLGRDQRNIHGTIREGRATTGLPTFTLAKVMIIQNIICHFHNFIDETLLVPEIWKRKKKNLEVHNFRKKDCPILGIILTLWRAHHIVLICLILLRIHESMSPRAAGGKSWIRHRRRAK